MFAWILKMIRYFQKQKALKLISKIEMYLLQKQGKHKKITIESNQVVERYVPNSCFQGLLQRCDIDRAYLEGDSPFRLTHGIQFETTFIQNSISNNPKCLRCKTGLLVNVRINFRRASWGVAITRNAIRRIAMFAC